MRQTNLLDETFDKSKSPQYHLSLQTGIKGLTYCILDTDRNKYIAFRHYPANNNDFTDTVLATDDLLRLTYKSVSLIMQDGQNTLVPEDLFEETTQDWAAKLNLNVLTGDTVQNNRLENCKTVNIFTCSQNLLTKFKIIHPDIKIFHYTTPVIDHMVRWSAKWSRTKMIIVINSTTVNIGLAQMRKLEFFNTFDYKDFSDILYYTLAVAEKNGISAQNGEFFVSADIDNSDEVFTYLKKYLQSVKTIRPSEQFSYSYVIDEQHLTRFFNLFNLVLCE
ncbi:MAG: DUF3822 family protein [Bacteroidota bacterium]|nr:DUF3822 family protein [Bacteroidota bacterium]